MDVDNITQSLPRPVRLFLQYMGRVDLAVLSASTTYYLVLSIVPLLITMLAIIPFTPLTSQDLIDIITIITPSFAEEIVVLFINAAYSQSVSLLSFSIITALWSASKGMMGVMKGLNEIVGVTKKINTVIGRIWAVIYTLGLLIVFFAMLIILVFGNQIVGLLTEIQPDFENALQTIMEYKMFLILIPAMILNTIMYTFIPMKKQPLLGQIPGALFSALGWGVLSAGFSIFVNFFGAGSLYGSLATPMMLMLWIYSCVFVLFIGAILNEVISSMREKD